MATIVEKARATIVLDLPFFASIILRHPMIADPRVSTMCVASNGQISYSPEWFETLPVNQAVFALCHEVLHYASMHGPRMGKRDPKTWNIACDQWVNDMLEGTGIGETIPGCVRAPGASKNTVENLYEALMQEDENDEPGQAPPGPGKGQPPPPGPGKGQPPPPGPGNPDPNGDPLGDDVTPPPPGQSEGEKHEQEANIKQEVAEAGQAAKMRGKLPGKLQDFIAATVDSEVPWFDVLERHMTEMVKNDYSWARANRRYAPKFYLPTLNGIGAMGEIVIQVDVSGSVSQRELDHYQGHLRRIVELCSPSKVHVIYTDTEVQRHDEYEQGEEISLTAHRGGGTDMCAGFDFIAEKGIEPVCVVTLTDGYTPFPEHTDYPAIWCISTDIKSPTGETIPFTMHDKG